MPLLAFLLMAAALGWWIGSMRRRRRAREQIQGEVTATVETGLPSEESPLGRRARAIAEAQDAKLKSPPPIHGTARWATTEDATGLVDGNLLRTSGSRGLCLGTLLTGDDAETGLPLVARYPGHLLTVAGTGQGKSATQIVENLLSYTGSVVVIDPKGELYDLTAARRREFGKVFRLAPLARTNEPPSDRYNPLEELDDDRELGARARRLAEMLVVRQGDKGAAEAAFFENEAINLLTAIIMLVVEMTRDPKRRAMRTLAEVRRICTLPMLAGRKERDPKIREYLEDVFAIMMKSENPYLRGQGGSFLGRDQKLLGSFLSEINSNLAFFDGHPGYAEVTASSDFCFADLASEPTTVYLTVPLKDMATDFRFLRAMVGLAFAALQEQREAREASVLFMLDEFAALRDMSFMKDAVAQMRSSGAWFWFFVQDIAQLEGVYDRWASVFLSQTDHQIYFGATLDERTKKHISASLGVATYAYRDANVSWAQSVGLNDSVNESPLQLGGAGRGRNIGQSVNIAAPVALAPKPLLTPFEVGTFLSHRRTGETHASTSIILSKQVGGFPVKARRRHWRDIAVASCGEVVEPVAIVHQPKLIKEVG